MREKARLAFLIFLLAFLARFLYIEDVKDSFLFYYPLVDSGTYELAAARSAEAGIGVSCLYNLHKIPFYQFFLSCIYRLGGRNIYLARLFQAALGALLAVFIFLLGEAVFGRKTGLLAGIIACFYWPFIAFGGKFLPVNPALLFSVPAVFMLCGFAEKGRFFRLVCGGALLALASLARPNILLVFPALAAWLLFHLTKKKGFMKGLAAVSVFALGFSAVTAPTVIRESSETKKLMPIQKNYGVGVYFGTSLEMINIKPGSSWKRLMRDALKEDLLLPGERNRYWLGRAKGCILENPFKYAAGIAEKFYILWNAYEFSPRENVNYFRRQSPFLSLPLFNFGFISAFSVLGMLMAWRGYREKAGALYVFVIAYVISLLPFMPLARYRLPLAGFLMLFASFAVLEFFKLIRGREWRNVAVYSFLFIPLFALTCANPMKDYLDGFSRIDYYRGLVYFHRNEIPQAVEELEKAFEKDPRDADIPEALGDVYLLTERLDMAERYYRLALFAEPEFPEAMEKLGIVLAKRGDTDGAIRLFKNILSSFSTENPSTHINLGNAYVISGRFGPAKKEYERALYLNPRSLKALERLLFLCEKTGDPDAGPVRKRLDELTGGLTK